MHFRDRRDLTVDLPLQTSQVRIALTTEAAQASVSVV